MGIDDLTAPPPPPPPSGGPAPGSESTLGRSVGSNGGCPLRDCRDHLDIQRKTFFILFFRIKSSITPCFFFRFFVSSQFAFTSSVFGLVLFCLILRETCRACLFFSFRMGSGGGSGGGLSFLFLYFIRTSRSGRSYPRTHIHQRNPSLQTRASSLLFFVVFLSFVYR